jgi:hypothetical protein
MLTSHAFEHLAVMAVGGQLVDGPGPVATVAQQ